MTTHIFPNPAETARALIGRALQIVAHCPPHRMANIALSGGSTPALMFKLWADEFGPTTPWERIRLFWVDERCVPPTHPESNYGMTRSTLLDSVPLPAQNIMRIHGEDSPELEAARYDELVRSLVPHEGGFPSFDLVMLGAGDDGHTSSIFPGQEHLLTAHEAYAVATHPTTGQQRIALTGMPIVHARHLAYLVTGPSKAPVVADMRAGRDSGPAAYLAHRALHHAELFADEAACAPLTAR